MCPPSGRPALLSGTRLARLRESCRASTRGGGTRNPTEAEMAEQQARQQRQDQQHQAEQRDEENKRRFTDQSGLEASDLPGGGRADPDTNPQHEMGRNLPEQHGGGGEYNGEGGLRGDRDISDADIHGNRGRN
jgi:hypothetical protein